MQPVANRVTRVCHLTTVHRRHDTRVFYKQCRSLAKAGFEVFLIVADGRGDSDDDGVQIIDIGAPRSRAERLTLKNFKCYQAALKVDAEVYHIHDPELLMVGRWLKRAKGKRVIFDSHEIVTMSILAKEYIPRPLRKPISEAYGAMERFLVRDLDGVVIPQSLILEDYFEKATQRVEVVRNYVSLATYTKELRSQPKPPLGPVRLVYAGSLSISRGIERIVELAHRLDDGYKVVVAGKFEYPEEKKKIEAHPGWKRVDYRGYLNKTELAELYHSCHVGLILFSPSGQYEIIESPLKLYEYLLFGLPVVTPSFAVWKEFEAKHEVTKCVDVDCFDEVKSLIKQWTQDPGLYEKLSSRAQDVVRQNYSWERESKVLVGLYEEILQGAQSRKSGVGPQAAA